MVTIRRLLVILLFVPFLSGANAQSSASGGVIPTAGGDFIASVTSHLTDPALPGAAAMASLLDLGSPASWRTPTRSGGGAADPLRIVELQTARTRVVSLDCAYLRYCHALDRAQTNVPITYGNPPPVSPT